MYQIRTEIKTIFTQLSKLSLVAVKLSERSKHAEWPTKQTSCSASVASGQQRCRELTTPALALAVEDFSCEWDIVVPRGNKEEVEWVGRGRRKRLRADFTCE